MKLDCLQVGALEVNCYIISNDNGDTLVIDPGGDESLIAHYLEFNKLTLKGILLTHAHFDHIGALPELSKQFEVPIYVAENDQELYKSPANCMKPWFSAIENLPEAGDEAVKIDGLEYEIIPTPGHTQGSVCFYFKEEGVVFTGDTLFAGGVGRTDLPGGNDSQLIESIKTKLLTLPEDTVVYPGHGGKSKIATEHNNPFLR